MLIQTREGRLNIDEALVLCVDRHAVQGDHAYVTVFLFTGEQITGIVQLSEPVDNLEPAPLAA
jgi:hypothetical protein